ncbi:Aste57867_13341 [Aphanomyces stellatus]|uniref:Aste57867_13341 protein n=1 Tax=Aphanomyces stellatus TaxID=120398 RepID=A0A485KYR4_9STRA|nr:hypothetical protein As57867_013291 [Aphanomyces stellatus]VFT90180.1 Aste57867_13341 [Aphanomyces stellatus]
MARKQTTHRQDGKHASSTTATANRKLHKNHGAHKAAQASKSQRQNPGRLPFPDEVLHLIFPYLTWRDTYRVGGVSRLWQKAHKDSLQHASIAWNSSLLQADSWDDVLSRLQPTVPCFAMPMAPHLALVVVSGQSHAFRRMTGWQKLFDVIHARHLLPSSCRIVCMYSDAGIIGGPSLNSNAACELEPDTIDEGIAVCITVGHLPGTDITLLTPDKESINSTMRQVHAGRPRTECAGFGFHDNATTSCVLLSTNSRQSAALVRCLAHLYPSLAVVGGILPFTDRCMPLVFRGPSSSILENATNLLVSFSGRVRATPFVSLGYAFACPILECTAVTPRHHPHFGLLHMYDAVHQVGAAIDVHPLQLLHGLPTPSGTLHLFIAATLADAHAFVANPAAAPLPSIECSYDSQHGVLFSQSDADDPHEANNLWPVGSYGVFCTQSAEAARSDFDASVVAAKHRIAITHGVPVGAVMFPCAARGEAFYEAPNVESDAFDAAFPGVPLTGVFAGGEIGPMAGPGGAFRSLAPQMQQFTTCGAVFYAAGP